MSSLSFLFSLPLFLPMSFTIIFSGQKQPCILHLQCTPFPDEAAALSLSSLSSSSTSAHLRSFSFVPHASSDVQGCVHHACQVRCSSGKPTPVTLHSLHIFTFLHGMTLTYPFINIYHKQFISCSLRIVSRHTCTCIILHMHITRYHISSITY